MCWDGELFFPRFLLPIGVLQHAECEARAGLASDAAAFVCDGVLATLQGLHRTAALELRRAGVALEERWRRAEVEAAVLGERDVLCEVHWGPRARRDVPLTPAAFVLSPSRLFGSSQGTHATVRTSILFCAAAFSEAP